jgi:hypothetical protein
MFNRALFWLEDFYNPNTVCVDQGDDSVFSEVPSHSWCSTSRTALEAELAELNSCSDLFAG